MSPHSNADLRVLLYRILGLMRDGVLPLFVFDGPQKPKWKRGKHVGGGCGGPLKGDFRKLLDLLGLPWRVAAGEGEAELAAMAKRGELDAVLTDDVDALLFGSPLIIRNKIKIPPSASQPSSSQPSSSQARLPHADSHRLYYAKRIAEVVGFEMEDLTFCALLSGGDYAPGMHSMGVKTAEALSRGGFGRELMAGMAKRDGDAGATAGFIKEWKASVVEELRTNSLGHLKTRRLQSAEALREDTSFPDPAVVKFYTSPAISVGLPPPQWLAAPDLPSLLPFLQTTFQWANAQMEQTCRNLLYPALALREIRQAALAADFSIPPSPSLPYFDSIQARKNESSTKNIDSYRVELDADTFALLVTSRLPAVDPFPITEDPTQQVPGRRKMPIKEATGSAPWRHWIPVEMIKEHPLAAKLGRGYERRQSDKEWEAQQRSPVKKKVHKSGGLADLFGTSKSRVGGGSKGLPRGRSALAGKGKGKKVTTVSEDEREDLPTSSTLFDRTRRARKNSTAPSDDEDSRTPRPPKSPRKSKSQGSAVDAPPKKQADVIELLDSDEEDEDQPTGTFDHLASKKISPAPTYSLSPPPRPRTRPSPSHAAAESSRAGPSSSFASTKFAASSSSLPFTSSKVSLNSSSKKAVVPAVSQSKSRSISIDLSDSEEENDLVSSKEMRRRQSSGSMASGSGLKGAGGKKGKVVSVSAKAVGGAAPRKAVCEEMVLSDSD